MIVMVTLVASCTGTTEPSVSAAPSVSPPSTSSSTGFEATASIDLPWLPLQGVVVERNGGIVFVALDGRVLAKLHGFELMNPTEAPGAVLVRRGTQTFVLDVSASILRTIDDARTKRLHVADDEAIALPTPPGMIVGGQPSGHWRFALLSPDGNRILAQWSGECEVPTAYMYYLQGGAPVPITGAATPPNIPESFVLGWTRGERALVVLPKGACGSGVRQPGVYTFDAPGSATLITTLPHIGLARMWGGR
jgi:hypothetical protein